MNLARRFLNTVASPALALDAFKTKPSDAPKAAEHWRRKGYKQEEINVAYAATMSGPKATPPRWKTLRRIIWQLRNGLPITGRRVRTRLNDARGTEVTRHPTKRREIVKC